MADLQRAVSPNVDMVQGQIGLLARQYNEMKSEISREESTRLCTFENERDGLRKDLEIIQQKIAQLEREYEADTKEWQQTSRAKLDQHMYMKVLAILTEHIPTELQTHTNAPSGERAQASRDRLPQNSPTVTPTRNSDHMPGPDNDVQLLDEPTKEVTRLRQTRRGRRPGLRSPPVENTSKTTNNLPKVRHGSRKRKRTVRVVQTPEDREMLDEEEPETSRPSKPKRRKRERTIEFKHLYEDGKIEPRHMIVEFPKGSHDWYILRCEAHMMSFGIRPIGGAAKHLNGRQHGELRKDAAIAIRELGVRVLGCNTELAERNNEAFRRACKDGHRPRTGNLGSAGVAETQQKPKKAFCGITDTVVGEIYQGYWRHSDSWYMVVILPFADFDEIGMSGKLADTGLIRHIPVCYMSAGKKIVGWDNDFKDGGPRVNNRKFPCLFLDDDLEVPPQGDFKLPERDMLSWLPAKFLRPADFQHPGGRKVEGQATAQKFRDRLEAMRKAQKQGSVIEDGENRQSIPPDSRERSVQVTNSSEHGSNNTGHHSITGEAHSSPKEREDTPGITHNRAEGTSSLVSKEPTVIHVLGDQENMPIELSDSSPEGEREASPRGYKDIAKINNNNLGDTPEDDPGDDPRDNPEGDIANHFKDQFEDNLEGDPADHFIAQFEDQVEDQVEDQLEDDFEDGFEENSEDDFEDFQEHFQEDFADHLEHHFAKDTGDSSEIRYNHAPQTNPSVINKDTPTSNPPASIPHSYEAAPASTPLDMTQILGPRPNQFHRDINLSRQNATPTLAEAAASALQLRIPTPSGNSYAPTGAGPEKTVDQQTANLHKKVSLSYITHRTSSPMRPQYHPPLPGGIRDNPSGIVRPEPQRIPPTHAPTWNPFFGNYPQIGGLSTSATAARGSQQAPDLRHIGFRAPDETYLNRTPGGNTPFGMHSSRYATEQGNGEVQRRGPGQRKFSRRTKTGCITCRRRRKKCDELKPACGNCLQSGHECLGYQMQSAQTESDMEWGLRPFSSFNMEVSTTASI